MKVLAVLAYTRKSLTCLVGGGIVWAQEVHDFHHLTRADIIGAVEVLAAALGVYVAANRPTPTL